MNVIRSGDQTINEVLILKKGKTTGFDYLRAGLSLAVILFHSAMTSYGEAVNAQIQSGWSRPFVVVILPSFFALSGFLVSGSLMRSKTIWEFLTLRAVRLIPALFFEVLLSAMLLGPLVTSFSWKSYFTDHAFFAYWLNILGEIHFKLPGVFLNNPDPEIVNRQLWTIPVELKCYGALTLISIFGIFKSSKKFALLFLLVLIFCPLYDVVKGSYFDTFNNVPYKVLIESFLCGALIYNFRNWIYLNKYMFIVSIFLTYVLLINRTGSYISCVPIAYATIYIGLLDTRTNVMSRVGEYSYGLYIYGYVIQQAYSYFFTSYRIWWCNAIFSVTVAMMFSYASWKFVEKPALDRRKAVVGMVEAFVQGVTWRASRLFKA